MSRSYLPIRFCAELINENTPTIVVDAFVKGGQLVKSDIEAKSKIIKSIHRLDNTILSAYHIARTSASSVEPKIERR